MLMELKRALLMNRNSQIRMTNGEIRRKTEIRRTNEPSHTRAPFDIRASDFFRHWSLVIGHSTTGSWSQCTVARHTEHLREFSVLPPVRRCQSVIGFVCVIWVAASVI